MSYPSYIEDSGCLPVFCGPYKFETNLASFFLKANIDNLKGVCDKYLNQVSNRKFVYKPLVPYVMMSFANMSGYSLDSEQKNVGYITEREVAFWIMTLAFKRVAGVLIPSHIAFFIPNLFVDNPYAMLTGREVYGFRKTQGIFTKLPENITNPEFSVDTMGYKEFSPTAVSKMYNLMSVDKVSNSNENAPIWQRGEARENILHLLTGLMDSDNILVDGLEKGVNLLDKFLDFEVPIVFLKQYRDATNTRDACYQAIVEAPAKPTDFKRGCVLFDEYELTLNELASNPIASELGLEIKDGKQKITTGFWSEFDFVLENGKEIYKSTN